MAWFPTSLSETLKALINLRKDDACMVRLRRCYATVEELRYAFATLNSNNFIVYSQKHKVWVLVFLVITCGAL